MFTWSRRAVTGVTGAILIFALAAAGGYRMAGLPGAGHSKVSLADGPRIWVAGTGVDLNNSFCSRTSPCQTFEYAIAKTVTNGEIDTIDPCSCGPVTINKSITIDGLGGGKSSIYEAGTPAITVAAGPNDVVVLRHLQLDGLGQGPIGIEFTSGKELILDDVVINNFAQHGVHVALSAPGTVDILNSRIQNNGGAGVAISTSSGRVQAHISHTALLNNYYGLVAGDGADVNFTNSVVSGSTAIGVGCQTFGNLPCLVQTSHDELDHNWAAIWMLHGAGNAQITTALSDDDIVSNTYGIYGVPGGTLNAVSFGNNHYLNNTVDGVASSNMVQK